MRWLFKGKRFGLGIGNHTGNSDGWEIGIDIVIGFAPWARVISLGWGYDAEIPLRPWPQLWLDKPTQLKHISSGFAWLGFYINVGRM